MRSEKHIIHPPIITSAKEQLIEKLAIYKASACRTLRVYMGIKVRRCLSMRVITSLASSENLCKARVTEARVK